MSFQIYIYKKPFNYIEKISNHLKYQTHQDSVDISVLSVLLGANFSLSIVNILRAADRDRPGLGYRPSATTIPYLV